MTSRRAITSLLFSAVVALTSCGGPVQTTSVSGDAFDFNQGVDARIASAHVFVLEDPRLSTTTDATGHFQIDGVPVGSDVTLVMEHPDYIPIQTGTHTAVAGGLTRLTFQAVPPNVRDALAMSLGITVDPAACQLVTTVTRIGRSLYDLGAHGEANVTVTIDPPLPASSGPIYFNSSVFPDRALTMTSDDGGVLFVNVPPGDYVWTAHETGAEFVTLRVHCRAGYLVNASPPWGLQRTL